MSSGFLLGQVDTLRQEVPDLTQEFVEDFLQNTETEGNFDFNTLFEELELYLENPLNLNEADEAILKEFQLLNDRQILDLLRYRQENGDLISLYELQAIPSFDLVTIRRIIPFVEIDGDLDDFQLPIGEMIRKGKNEIYIRWNRILEDQKGYQAVPAGSEANRYLGDPNGLYLRYKHSYSNRLSYGYTAEKDRGEEFFYRQQ